MSLERLHVIAVVTRNCNLRCGYCLPRKRSARMSRETVGRLVEALKAAGPSEVNVDFNGGETLLAFSTVLDAVDRMRASLPHTRFRFGVCTNGTQLTPARIRRLIRRDINLQVSCDGMETSHVIHRRPKLKSARSHGLYERVIRGIREAVRQGLSVRINMVVTPETAGRIVANMKYLYGLGADFVSVSPAIGMEWSRDGLAALEASLVAAAEEEARVIKDRSAIQYVSDKLDEIRYVLGEAEKFKGVRSFVVDWDGSVHGDEYLTDAMRESVKIGDLSNPRVLAAAPGPPVHSFRLVREGGVFSEGVQGSIRETHEVLRTHYERVASSLEIGSPAHKEPKAQARRVVFLSSPTGIPVNGRVDFGGAEWLHYALSRELVAEEAQNGRRRFRADREILRNCVEVTERHPGVVFCEAAEALAVEYARRAWGRSSRSYIVVDVDACEKVRNMNAWIECHYGASPFPDILNGPGKHWIYTTRRQRAPLRKAGLDDSRLHYLPTSVWLYEMLFPAVGPAIRSVTLRSDPDGGAVSVGNNNRDFLTLARAFSEPEPRVDVYSGREDSIVADVSGIRWHRPVPFVACLERMARATAVVVPLKDNLNSGGQMTLVLAMRLGKAVVVSDVAAVRDYVEPEVTGLLVEPGDPAALREAVRRLLSDLSLARRLGMRAREAEVGLSVEAKRTFGRVLDLALEEAFA